MSITDYSLKNPKVVHFFLIILLIAGVSEFFSLGKSEDAKFVIKQVAITCEYPGASQWEVEELITDLIEEKVQQVPYIKHIKSESMPGMASIDVEFMPIHPSMIPQKFDELRRKATEAEQMLPAGAGPISVNDMFGDVLGIYMGVYADEGIDYNTLNAYAKFLKRELATIEGVSKVDLYGQQQRVVNIEISLERLANLGINPDVVYETIRRQSQVNNIGFIDIGRQQFRVDATNSFESTTDIGDILVRGAGNKSFRVRDIANIKMDYQDPPSNKMRMNGKQAIGLAVANQVGENVVETGDKVLTRIEELLTYVPVGIHVEPIYLENKIADKANNDFVINLLLSVFIVIVTLMFAMGFRPSILIGSSLLFSIVVMLLFIEPFGLTLNRTTLAAVIIAMGMLVDNAIVVTDNAMTAIKRGESKYKAFLNGARIPMWGLFGATLIAIASFLPLQLAKDDAAEVIQPLFIVLSVSLFLSWIFAIIQTPVYGMFLLKQPKAGVTKDPYDSKFYKMYGTFLSRLIQRKWRTIGITFVIFIGFVVWGSTLSQSFFPFMSNTYFKAQYWLPYGTQMDVVEEDVKQIEEWIMEQEGMKNVSVTLGGVPMRYDMAAISFENFPNLAHFLFEYEDPEPTFKISKAFEAYVHENYPDARVIFEYWKASPTPKAELEATFMGPDPEVLRQLCEQAKDSMRKVSIVQNVRDNWYEKIPVLRPQYSQYKGRLAGVTKQSVTNSLSLLKEGINVGEYRERDEVLPVLIKETTRENFDNSNMGSLPVFSENGTAVPLDQVIDELEINWENGRINRFNRQRSIVAQCDPVLGIEAPEAEAVVIPMIESMELPEGYTLMWDGLKKYSDATNKAIGDPVPLTMILMFSILLLLFKRFQEPLMLFIMLPMIYMGVVLGLKLFGFPQNFMATLGLLGLIGMVIKNGVVLLEQVELEIKGGMAAFDALLSAAQSRMIPVSMAALTTILGMSPLITDPLYGAMSATIMGGLLVATIITLIVLPTLYAVFFNVKKIDKNETES